jgi:hypothetical protein
MDASDAVFWSAIVKENYTSSLNKSVNLGFPEPPEALEPNMSLLSSDILWRMLKWDHRINIISVWLSNVRGLTF